jgi:glycosyltransferase involved in cell wall biosynthesis
VVVCTRDRPDSLQRTLDSLQRLDYSSFEVIIVDNCPTTQATRDLVARYPFRYVVEERPGLDWARNRGIVEARGDIIAYTDDDVCVDRGWLYGVVAGFIAPDVMCVTGMVLPGELETAAQKLFEVRYGGMNKGFRQRIFDQTTEQPYMPYLVSQCGVGANMAFRRELFHHIGKFDEALDVGTASGGGGDLDMFYRVIQASYCLVYEPTAIVYHYHRRDDTALRRQIYQNGTAISAYLIKCIRSQPGGGWPAMRFTLRWLWKWYIKRLLRSFRRKGGIPRELIFTEVRGLLRGPWLYRQALREAQALARQQ